MGRCIQVVGLVIIGLSTGLSASAQYRYYDRGFDNYQSGKYEAAIANFNEFLAKPSTDKTLEAEVYYLRGLSYFRLGKCSSAHEDFEEAILRSHPNKGNIYWFVARCYDDTGFYSEALESYDNALRELETDPETAVKILLERSRVHLKLNDSIQAYADLERGYHIQPGNETVKQQLALLQEKGLSRPPSLTPPNNKEDLNAVPRVAANKTLAEFYKDEKRYALVFGNSTYPQEIGTLRNPVNDAVDLAAELERSNFEVQLVTNATYGQMRAALLKFKQRIDAGNRDQTVALFYFAGHGLRIDDENYLVPVDARIEFVDDIWRYCFPVQKMVLTNMENSNARMNIIILDACRSNPFPSLTRAVANKGLGEMKKGRGSFIAFATAPGSVASDGPGRNGLYTEELIKAIKIPGYTIEQVFKEVRLNVYRRSGGRQNTWDTSNITGEFYFKF